ncbi:MAG: hypothetical protein C0629_13985 [Chromatiales bacterium]|nr:MAG: hypothetical protein C0629_13985 [Chromatiales bacterium]
MTERMSNQPTRWFWILAIAALVWNLLGVMAYVMQVSMTEEALALLPEDQRVLYETVPAWATAAFAIAVFAGALGCIALLLRKSWATPVFVLSLAGVLVQMFHSLFLSDALEVYGASGMVMPILILVIAVWLVGFSRSAAAKGWLT